MLCENSMSRLHRKKKGEGERESEARNTGNSEGNLRILAERFEERAPK